MGKIGSSLRYGGAVLLLAFGLLMMALSFGGREAGDDSARLSEEPLGARLRFATAFVENWFYDLRTERFYEHHRVSPNLVVLELSDRSLAQMGRYPWTRSVYAKLLDNLNTYGARVVMFDAFFPEPESKKADGAFAAGIERFAAAPDHAAILGYGLTFDGNEALSPLPDPLLASALNGKPPEEKEFHPAYLDRNNFAAPDLQSWEARFGAIISEADRDGVFRQAFLLHNIEQNLLPSLGTAGFVHWYKIGGREVYAEALPLRQGYVLHLKDGATKKRIKIGPRGEIKLRYFGDAENFRRVPVEEVFADKDPATNQKLKSIFSGKAVLFGSSALGAHDLRHTPVAPQMPGFYVHANLFHALDQNYFFRAEDDSFFFSLLLFGFGVGGVLLLSRLRDPRWEAGGALALLGIIFAADYFYFAPAGYFIRLFAALFTTVLLYAWFTLLNLFAEAREKKRIRDTFTRYVAPEVVKQMLNHPEKLKVGGEKKEISMLFSDVRDFTTISERLSPGDLAQLLNLYMGRMTDILFASGGTLDKYIGDALVGFWGAPLDDPDHAYRAVKGAGEMLEALPTVNEELRRRGLPAIQIGLGLNTGEVSVGNMGSDRIFQYTALGDAMNLASRLEALTKHYGVGLLLSEFTVARLGERRRDFRLRPIDLVRVKGKERAVRIYELIPQRNAFAEEVLRERFTRAYEELYLGARFAEARAEFAAILGEVGEDEPTRLLRKNCEEFLASPPPAGWDGVTIFRTK